MMTIKLITDDGEVAEFTVQDSFELCKAIRDLVTERGGWLSNFASPGMQESEVPLMSIQFVTEAERCP